MRLGKTVQALAWLQLRPELRPAIVVCPATVKINWERETKAWLSSPNTQILNGRWGGQETNADIIIVNYDILADIHDKKKRVIQQGWLPALRNVHAKVLILDECQKISNNSARTKAIKTLAKNIPHILGLSGTPIRKRPIQFYNILQLIDKQLLPPSRFEYATRYCGAHHNGFGWDFNGASNIEELHHIISRVMIRRTQKEIYPELPERIRSYIPLELDNRKEYDAAENNFTTWAKEQAVITHRELQNRTEALKQLATKGKMKNAVQWIKDFLDGSEEKLVVFAWHHFAIHHLMEAFPGVSVQVTGAVTGAARQSAIDSFQTDPTRRLFLGNIEAGGIGISLAAASTVAFVELGQGPSDHDQAEQRIFHIGKTDVLTTYYLLGENTIEERVARLIDRERKVLSQLLDGKPAEHESLLWTLIKEYQRQIKQTIL